MARQEWSEAQVERALERQIVELLEQREPGRTICPSEAARAVFLEAEPGPPAGDESHGWRDLMEPARRAAGRLVAKGEIDVTQGGRVVDLSTATGPIRLRRRP